MKRDLLRLVDLSRDECMALFALATEIKTALRSGKPKHLLAGKTLAMIFDKPSTRTRVSFEVGIRELGGQVMFLNAGDIQMGRGRASRRDGTRFGTPPISRGDDLPKM